MRRRALGAMLLFIMACGAEAPVADDHLARRALSDLQRDRIAAVQQRADSAAASPVTPLGPALERLGAALRSYEPADSALLVGWEVFDAGARRRAGLTYELAGNERWALVTVEISGTGDGARFTGFRLSPIERPLEEANAFFLRGKSFLHYLTLVLACACALGTLVAAVLVARTPMRRRWAWAFAALIGAGQFQLDWATGEWQIRLFILELFASGVARVGPYAPWVISYGLPLGAILALRRRRRALRERDRPVEPASAEGTAYAAPGSTASRFRVRPS